MAKRDNPGNVKRLSSRPHTLSEGQLDALTRYPVKEVQEMARAEQARRASVSEGVGVLREAHFLGSPGGEQRVQKRGPFLRRAKRDQYEKEMGILASGKPWSPPVKVTPVDVAGAAQMEREAPAGMSLWHQSLLNKKAPWSTGAKVLGVAGALAIAPAILKMLRGSPTDEETQQAQEDDQRRAFLAQKMRADRLKMDVQVNMQRIMAMQPDVAQELMAGRRLPKGATVLGGTPRQDLLEQFAQRMTAQAPDDTLPGAF